MKELDVIELLAPVGEWPTGTTGTVLELFSGWALVEVSNDDGEALDTVDVPLDGAKVVWSVEAQRSADGSGEAVPAGPAVGTRRRRRP